MSAREDRTRRFLAVSLCFVALWAIFQFAFPYHLAFKERYVLFLSESSWLTSYFSKPAPLSFITGDWLTQFFLLPGAPALITTVLLLVIWDGFRHVAAALGSRRPGGWALLPVAVLAVCILSPEVPLAILTGTALFAWLFAWALQRKNRILRYALLLLSLVLLVPTARSLMASARMQWPDREREYDYRIYCKASLGQWDTVEKLGRRNPHESLMTSYYYNLSQARRDKLPDGLLQAYQPTYHGLLIPVKPGVECFRLMASTDALYLAGDYAQAQHSAMLGMTFSPRQRSAEMVKAMADIAFANGDYDTARRYLWMLSKTLFYKRWAREGLQLLEAGTDQLAIKNDCRDQLIQHNDFRTSLANIAATSTRGKTAADYLLCLDLLDKNLDHFRTDYDTLYKGTYDFGGIPVLYQEALLMTFDENTSPADQLTAYGIARTTLDNCTEFLKGNETRFRTSYWFYYKYAQPAE